MPGNTRIYSFSKLAAVHIHDAKPADFETAILAAGYGRFNLILYLITITAGWSSIFETTTMSYVFPAAECDLRLSLTHKGWLNAITYAGMVSTAFVWGYLCDTLGRKKLLVIGYLLDGIFVALSALSQNFGILVITKFLGGVIINGPFAALTSYLSEFHCAKHRARVQMVLGTIFSIGNLLLPLLALGILPVRINFLMGNWVLHSWNFYLLICALPPLVSGIAFIFLPESPKFLMTVGNNEEALMVFKQVYHSNTGYSEDTYPNMNNTQVYTNSMIVAAVSIVGYITAGTLINTIGKKKLLNILGLLAGIVAITMYFSTNIITTVAMSSVFVAFGSISMNVILSIVVDLFPTTLRTMTVSFTMMFGRLGAGSGNLIFPYLLQSGCGPPFVTVGSVMIGCAILTCFLPNTDMKALE